MRRMLTGNPMLAEGFSMSLLRTCVAFWLGKGMARHDLLAFLTQYPKVRFGALPCTLSWTLGLDHWLEQWLGRAGGRGGGGWGRARAWHGLLALPQGAPRRAALDALLDARPEFCS